MNVRRGSQRQRVGEGSKQLLEPCTPGYHHRTELRGFSLKIRHEARRPGGSSLRLATITISKGQEDKDVVAKMNVIISHAVRREHGKIIVHRLCLCSYKGRCHLALRAHQAFTLPMKEQCRPRTPQFYQPVLIGSSSLLSCESVLPIRPWMRPSNATTA